jgi:Holliday junction resolvase RusA-like endonuclease
MEDMTTEQFNRARGKHQKQPSELVKVIKAAREPAAQTKRFTVYGRPVGAPRMTQRDNWKQRPCVMRYRAWKDEIRKVVCWDMPPVEQIQSVSWVAYFEPPTSWSAKKKAAALGKLHRSKPDRDNVDKAILDTLFKEDSGIASGMIEKRWGTPERIEVSIVYQE